MRNQDTTMTSNEAMRRISAQPFGLRRQTAISGVTPPRRTVIQYAFVIVPWIWPPGARNAAHARFCKGL